MFINFKYLTFENRMELVLKPSPPEVHFSGFYFQYSVIPTPFSPKVWLVSSFGILLHDSNADDNMGGWGR